MNASVQHDDRLKALLKDLGRSTLRGIGRCYKCGTLNGTRGLSCKNKACDVVFTEAGRKKKQSMEVCKLHTGSSPQVFSVRVREKGPDFRGFVQLPAVQSKLEESDAAFLSPVTALCFVESCQRLFNTNILKCHESDLAQSATACQHIQSAMRCCSNASVLPIDYKMLQTMNTSQLNKDAIWQLSRETLGLVVQRVSKTIMAVKCKVTTKHPLGFLHITFSPSSKWKDKDWHHFCTCSTSKNHIKSVDSSKYCIHYYACVAAFASDPKLSAEFSAFVLKESVAETYTIEIDPNDDDNRLVEILNNTINQSEAEIEVLQKGDDTDFILPALTTDLDGLPSIVDVTNDLETGLDAHTLSPVIAKFQESPSNTKSVVKPRKKKASLVGISKKKDRSAKKEFVQQYFPFSGDTVDPNSANFPFINWLASVTESINQSMHIQFGSQPEPLVFRIPQTFFDCLGERLMCSSIGGTKRKRLPNLVSTVTRKTCPPLGTFYSFIWHITSLAHAKAIFDTPILSLKASRSFIQKADGTYEEVDPVTLEEGLSRREGERSIRPVEIKTFLKIGTNSPEQDSSSILSINWTPNLLPISKIGELKIAFECCTFP